MIIQCCKGCSDSRSLLFEGHIRNIKKSSEKWIKTVGKKEQLRVELRGEGLGWEIH